MPGIVLVEAAVDQLLAFLQANLDAQVAAIAGDYPAHPLALPAIASWHDAEMPYGSAPFPEIEVLAVSTDGSGIDDPAYYGSSSGLLVNVIDLHGDPSVLRRRAYRYARAVFLCVRAMQQLGVMLPGWINYAERGRIIDYDARQFGPKTTIGMAQLQFTATMRESA